jgi:hypothetical protein
MGTALDSASGVRKTKAALWLVLAGAGAAGGQTPRRAHEIPSMGQPRVWEPYIVPGASQDWGDWRSSVVFGVHRPLTNPVVGLLGVKGEVFGAFDPGVGAGVRLFATSPVLGLSAGGELGGELDWPQPIFSFQTAIRRGGLFGHATMARVDWKPGRSAFNVGLHIPFTKHAGTTRPFDTDVEAPAPRQTSLSTSAVPREAETALAAVGSGATTLLAYTNLYPERGGGLNDGPSYTVAIRRYREGLLEAFNVAAGNPVDGGRVTARARAGLLDQVLLPYDSLFGRVKENGRSIRPLTSSAHAGFVAWLRDSSRVNSRAQPAIAAVHARWLGVIEAMHRSLLHQWRDSRLVWLPLQLALNETDYDEQAEVDSLIARAVGRPFTDQNALTYLKSADLPLEIARSIFAARDYHVLWTHDFTGQREQTGSVDEVAFAMVSDAYLPALTAAVQRYDSTRVLPVYMLLIDQFFYEPRRGRLWMDILQNPLRADMKLPGSNAAREAHLRMRQDELRTAVAKSWRLQQDANANGGARWLEDVVKINVSVMNPSDFSYRSRKIVPPWPFMPDNTMRDHRKFVFYDLTEADPYRGAAIVMGVGVGEHYASPTWEDRGYRMRGPAALEVRAAARRAFLANGFGEKEVPFVLRASSRRASADSREYVGRALQVHNDVGFGEKEASIARAMLYNLAPAGSVIIVPDPMWLSDTWAAMLASAAARGCRVFVISPAPANNPVPHPMFQAVQHDVMTRLLDSRDRMRKQLQETGGELRVGLFDGRAPVNDVAGRIAEVRQGLRRAPWIRTLIPFDDKTLSVLNRAVATESDGDDASRLAQDERPREPQLHQKSQLIARPGAIAALVSQPGWDDVLARSMEAQSRQTAKFTEQLGYSTPDIDSSATRTTDAMIRGFETALSDAERKAVSFYFTVGTQNQDPRGIMLDGEAAVIVSGLHAASGLVDFYYLMARSTWVDSRQDLERVLPPPKGLWRRLGRMARLAL